MNEKLGVFWIIALIMSGGMAFFDYYVDNFNLFGNEVYVDMYILELFAPLIFMFVITFCFWCLDRHRGKYWTQEYLKTIE